MIFTALFLSLWTAALSDKVYIGSFFLVNAGASTPYCPVPTMNWTDWDDMGPKELTPVGMREQYLLGKEMRRRCEIEMKTISPEYLREQVSIRTTYHNNTINSAQAFSRGFFNNEDATLNDVEIELANPPIGCSKDFRKTLGKNVLPYKLNTTLFYTVYPTKNDSFDIDYCAVATDRIKESFMKNRTILNYLRSNEKRLLSIIDPIFGNKEKFPEYFPLLESIRDARHHFKDEYLTFEEEEFVESFTKKLYHNSKATNDTEVEYRALTMLKFIKDALSDTLQSTDDKKTPKVHFAFVREEMIVATLSILAKMTKDETPPSTILALNLYDDKKSEVELFYNDELIESDSFRKIIDFENFASTIDGKFKALNFTEHCKK